MGHRFGAEVEVALHLVAGGFQGLGVDFPEDFLFGEVLRADRQADFAVFGVGDDRSGASPSSLLLRAVVVAAAAGGDSEAEGEREQHGERLRADEWAVDLI